MARPERESTHCGPGAERRGIQSIEVGGTLLQALAGQGSSMALKDLSTRAGMPPAKAHPYLVSLGKLGLVEQDPLTGRYRLGPFALQLGLSALHALDPVRVAIGQAALLADEIQQNVAIAVWGNRGPTIIHIEEARRPIHVNMRPGTVMTPLLLSATGRVFAAFMPERVVSAWLEQEAGEPLSHAPLPEGLPTGGAGHSLAHNMSRHPDSRSSTAPQDERLAETRRQGLARAIGHPIPGINAFSAPVRYASGQLALAITAMGVADAFDADWDSPLARRLRQCAQHIEYRLGRVPDGAPSSEPCPPLP